MRPMRATPRPLGRRPVTIATIIQIAFSMGALWPSSLTKTDLADPDGDQLNAVVEVVARELGIPREWLLRDLLERSPN
jgi:hypothetical protein